VTGTLHAPKKISAKTPSDFEIKAKILYEDTAVHYGKIAYIG
jgi:hypothetical protein